MVIVARLARAVEQERTEGLHQPGVAAEHRVQFGGHRGCRGPPAGRGLVGQRDLVPHLVGGQGDEVVLAAHVPIGGRRRGAKPVAQCALGRPRRA
jgi:hypothetical protein